MKFTAQRRAGRVIGAWPVVVDAEEVGGIASYITQIDLRIPYSFPGFYPDYPIPDLPATPGQLAEDLIMAVIYARLEKNCTGNRYLLGLVHGLGHSSKQGDIPHAICLRYLRWGE